MYPCVSDAYSKPAHKKLFKTEYSLVLNTLANILAITLSIYFMTTTALYTISVGTYMHRVSILNCIIDFSHPNLLLLLLCPQRSADC